MIRPPFHSAPVVITIVIFLSLFPAPILAQRYCCEGDSWLKWNQSRRDAYIRGYTEGYYDGYDQGCHEGTKNSSVAAPTSFEDLPLNKCLDQKSDFKKGIDLSKDITAFYKRYPENRNLLIEEILEELGKGRSIEDIHQHPPFPAIEQSKGGGATQPIK